MSKKGILAGIFLVVALILIIVIIVVRKKEVPEVVTNESLPFKAYLVVDSEINDVPLRVVKDVERRTLGLSGFTKLEEGTGMLFVFDGLGPHPFWMKDMNFPIDIIWLKRASSDDLGGTFEVIHVESNVEPNTYPQSFSSVESTDTVIEINAGFADEYGLIEGRSVVVNAIP